MKLTEIAWLAGLLEGEGSFVYSGRSAGIVIATTDYDVIAKAAALFDRPMYQRREPAVRLGTLPVYGVTCWGGPGIGWMLTLYCFMGIRRQEQIRNVLSKWRAAPGIGYGRHYRGNQYVSSAKRAR